MAGLWPRVMAWKAPFKPDPTLFSQGLDYFWTGWKQWIVFNLAFGKQVVGEAAVARPATAPGPLRDD
jgi:hypothetical protein